MEFAARTAGLRLSARQRVALLNVYLQLPVWPDVEATLSLLRASNRSAVILSNATSTILGASLKDNGLEGAFDLVLTTDDISTYKPDPRAYRLAMERTGRHPQEILFVAFAGWDAAGARWFGFPTFWNNRLSAPAEELGAAGHLTGSSLADLHGLLHLESRE